MKPSENICNMDNRKDKTTIQGELQNPTTESGLAQIIAPVVTRKGKQRMLQSGQSPPFQESRPPTPTAVHGEIPPPPPPVTPLSRARTRKQKDQNTPDPLFLTQVTARRQRRPLVRANIEKLTKQQRKDSHLLGKKQDLDDGRTRGGTCSR